MRPFLFRMDAEEAHAFATRFLPLIPPVPMPESPLLATDLGDPRLRFAHPVGLAAGFDKNGRWIRPLARLGFSSIEVGTVTPRAQPGNDRPRLFRYPEQRALVNRLGFNNDGAEALLARLRGGKHPVPVGINLGKQRETPPEEASRDYAGLAARLAGVADYFVLNV
ncbi:MAG: dihydroorotate dehydrogenase (quinone), partial [Gemmatimonadetes bacterium]|nr:dihydroorotate dehydrogenase (quinone) [Gemmatimonadota bacterium]